MLQAVTRTMLYWYQSNQPEPNSINFLSDYKTSLSILRNWMYWLQNITFILCHEGQWCFLYAYWIWLPQTSCPYALFFDLWIICGIVFHIIAILLPFFVKFGDMESAKSSYARHVPISKRFILKPPPKRSSALMSFNSDATCRVPQWSYLYHSMAYQSYKFNFLERTPLA